MIVKLFSSLLARKIAVFCGVLAVALACMSGALPANRCDEPEAWAQLAAAPAKTPSQQNLAFASVYRSPSLWDMTMQVSAADEPDTSIRLADWAPMRTPEHADFPERDSDQADGNPAKQKTGEKGTSSPKFVYSSAIPLSEELQRYTHSQCELNGLDYELVLALMWRESRFQTQVVNVNYNGTRDSGIMQINDVNQSWLAREHGITDLMDPKQNIAAGTAILGAFTRKYGEHNALLAYQYGETGMERKLAQGVTTNKQIQMVYAKRADFAAILAQ